MSLDITLYNPTTCNHCGQSTGKVMVWSDGISYNLFDMAKEVGLYCPIRYPKHGGITKAIDMIPLLSFGISGLKNNQEIYRRHAPEKMKAVSDLLQFAIQYLHACNKYPEAEIAVCG